MQNAAGRLVLALAGVSLLAVGPIAQSQQRPVFRAGADLIVVDVQVVDRRGVPIADLKAEDFVVRVDRSIRKVVSAQFLRHEASSSPARATEPEAAAPAETARGVAPAGRSFILAVDESSFRARNALAAMQAARRFIENLEPDDRIGLFKYPVYPKSLELTTEHASVLEELQSVIGVLEVPQGRYNLSLSEVIDITAEDSEILDRVVARECGTGYKGLRRNEILTEARQFGMIAETQVAQSAAGMRALFDALSKYPERKTVVLVSGGLLASDRVGGRPDVTAIISDIGERAARSNTNLYVLHMDSSFIDAFSATGGRIATSFMREATALGAGLDRFAGIAGGALVRVEAGTGDYAFQRVLRETSAYYLLGIEVEPDDRDGRPHFIDVDFDRRGAEIRSRRTVVIPAAGE